MGICVVGEDLVEDEVLHLPESAARRDVVGIDERLTSERPVDRYIVADQPGA